MYCKFCYSNFKHKYHLKRHLKTHLGKANGFDQKDEVFKEIEKLDSMDPIKNNECHICHKKYTSKYTLDRHLKESCVFSQVRNLISKYGKSFTTEQKQDILNMLNIPINTVNTINNTINNTIDGDHNQIDNSQNINVNIKVLNIGEENLEMIKTPEFINEIIQIIEHDPFIQEIGHNKFRKRFSEKSLDDAIVKTFEKVNCNPDYPENHNLYVTDKSPYKPFGIRKNDNWDTSRGPSDVQLVISVTKDNINEALNHNSNSEETYEEHISQLEGNYYKKEYASKELCYRILLTAYNNQDIIKKTYQETRSS